MTFPVRVGANAIIVRKERLLLVEFNDETGVHYNLPGGGIEVGESIKEGLRREVYEETCAEIEVGDLAFVIEYEPKRNAYWGGATHKLTLIFACCLSSKIEPRLPVRPDASQAAVCWVPLAELESAELLPHVSKRLTEYLEHSSGTVFLEEPLEPGRIRRYMKS